jgi:hypothetical protein
MSRCAYGSPDERPVPLLHRGWAIAITRRSRELTPAQKLVYERMIELDRGRSGCFESLEGLAGDVALAPDTCRKIRKELLDRGLLHQHRVKTAIGIREFWYCALPFVLDECTRSRKQWLQDYGVMLDNLLANYAADSGIEVGPGRQTMPPTTETTPIEESAFPVLVCDSESVNRVCERQSVKVKISSSCNEESESENVKGVSQETAVERWEKQNVDPTTLEILRRYDQKRTPLRGAA